MKSLLGLIGLCERQIGIMIDFVSLFIKMSSACRSFIKSLKFAIAIVNTKISCLASLLSTFTMVLRTESIDLNFTLSLGVAVEPDGPDDFFLFLSVLSAPLISVLPVQQL